jgi:hypothetical protein
MAQPGLVLQHSLPKNAAPATSIPISPSLRRVFDKLSLSLTLEEILEAFDKLQQISLEDLHRLVRDFRCPGMLPSVRDGIPY